MPYIIEERRREIDSGVIPQTCGELNYLLTMMCLQAPNHTAYAAIKSDMHAALNLYVAQFPELRYQVINDIMGALDGAAREFVRREHVNAASFHAVLRAVGTEFYQTVASPYEDGARLKNGDIAYVCLSSGAKP